MPRSLWQCALQMTPVAAGHVSGDQIARTAAPNSLRDRVAGRVGHVARRARPRVIDLAEHLHQVVAIAARGVLGGELDVVDVLLARTVDRPAGGVEHLLAAHHQLVLEMDVRGGDEDVDAGLLRLLDAPAARARCRLRLVRARLQHDRRAAPPPRPPHRLEVAVDEAAKPASITSTPSFSSWRAIDQLLLDVHRRARRLLAVAQRRVEDLYPVHRRVSPSERATSGRRSGARNGQTPRAVDPPVASSSSFGSRPYTPTRPPGGLVSSRPRSSPFESLGARTTIASGAIRGIPACQARRGGRDSAGGGRRRRPMVRTTADTGPESA